MVHKQEIKLGLPGLASFGRAGTGSAGLRRVWADNFALMALLVGSGTGGGAHRRDGAFKSPRTH